MDVKLPSRPESTSDLAAGIVEDAQKLVRLEIELAKAEAKELAIRNGVAAGLFLGAATFAMLGLLVALPVLLVVLLPWHWQAALVWLGLYLAGAAVMGLVGRRFLRIGMPERTVASVRETKEWFSSLIRSHGN